MTSRDIWANNKLINNQIQQFDEKRIDKYFIQYRVERDEEGLNYQEERNKNVTRPRKEKREAEREKEESVKHEERPSFFYFFLLQPDEMKSGGAVVRSTFAGVGEHRTI